MKKLTVGIIGAGRIGRLHSENILKHFPDVLIKTIADPLMDEKWATGTGIENVVSDHQEILNDPDIEAVLICSPSPTHAPLIIEAAKSGKHIFCEKPIALNPEVITAALKEVDKTKVKLQVGFNRRFDPGFAHVKRQVQRGEIGTPHIIKITSRDPEPPNPAYIKESGGLFLDMTIHDFDMARFLADSEVIEVYASGAVLVDPEIGKQGDIDTAIITLKFASGALGVIDNSRKAVYGYDQRVEVFGSLGAVMGENRPTYHTRLMTQNGVISPKPLFFFLERYQEAFIEEMRVFFATIREDRQSPVTGKDGLMPVVIGLAANQSLVKNQPIKIPLTEDKNT
ncbi:inositol 2-dehydrogenase [bacterium]|nr:inositol 2-dehydrogenase [bacterium]